MPNHLPRRLVLAWLFCVALFLAAVWGLTPGSGALAEGEAADCCAEHSEEVSHGPSHHFFGVNMDARNPDNVICEPDSNDESIRCPDACTRPVPAGTPRVRRAIHTLTAEQWTRVVNAMWVMRTVSTKDGVEKYGPFYRDWDYFLWLHGAHGGAVVGAEFDVTGGASHFATWHGAHTLDFETSLLAVDPAIEALPYLDWVAMPVRSALFNEYLGEPSDAALLAYYEGWKDCSKWSVRCATWQVMGHSEYMRFALSQDSGLGIIDNGPFRNWPVATGGLVSPGGRTLTTLARQKSIQDVKFSGNDWVAFWGDADGFLAALRAKQPAGVFAGLPAPLFDLLKDYSLDLNATQWRDPFLAAPVPFLVRNVRAPPEPSYQQVENGTFVAELVETCLELGSWFGELVNCLQGRLAEQTFDMHDNWHTSLGGDVMGIGGPNDPAFWFHHAAVDKLRLHWQARNPQLRSRAWGYFVKGSFSSRDTCQSANSALTDLNDVIGAPPNGESEGNPKLWAHRHDELLFGVGFDRERLMGRADAGMEATVSTPMTNADMLCGDVEALYTFDVIVADEQRAQRRQASLAQTAQVAWVSLLLSLLGMAVLLRPTLRVLHARCGGDGGIGGRAGSGAGVPARMAAAVLPGSRAKRYGAKRPYEEYDMTFNDASDQARGAEVHAPRR